MATTVTYIEEVNGSTVEREVQLSTTEFSVKLDTTGSGEPDTLFSPVVTQSVEIENDGDSTTPSDQCGNTERRRTTNEGWSIRVSGIVTANERGSNLSLQLLRDVIAPADSVQIRSDVLSGEVSVSNTVITQSSDLVSIVTDETEGEEKAFEFQLQLGESQSGDS